MQPNVDYSYTSQKIIKEETSFQLNLINRNISHMDKRELEYMLNRSARKLRYKSKRSTDYVNKLNDILDELNSIPSTILSDIPSHKFYFTIRNIIRDLLLDWHSSCKLNQEETYLLRNCILLFNRLVDTIEDITKLTSWLPDLSLINALAECMSDIDRILSFDKEKYNFKQLTHLLDMFNTYYQKLPLKLQNENRLLEATMDCLISSNYDRAFRKLKPNAQSMSSKQTFFLIKCPSFLTNFHNSPSNKIIQQLLETMIPRYASVLDKHIQSLNEWKSPMIHAVHHLLLTVIYAHGHYTPYATGQPIQWLIDHLIRMISEKSLIKKITEKATTPETLLIDSILRTLVAFIHEPDLLVYIKQLKITSIFHSLIVLPYESIVIHAYVMLSYTLEEDDIKASEKDSGRLLSNIFDTLRMKIKKTSKTNKNQEINEQNIALLVEAVQVLVQHDQIKSEILKQNALSLLINSCEHFNHRSKRLLLESLGSITFDQEAARVLREDTQFVNSVENMQKTSDDGINKAAEKIIWNLIKEPEKAVQREKKTVKEVVQSDGKKQEKEEDKPKKDEYQYDIMISYCHADKEAVYRIHKYLSDKGYKIWLDRDNIYGPAMQAMADAVENSEFVIICMSDSYKRSVYCQAEAEYAFRLKRRLLPLIVRQGYRADGWLGFIMGSRIYIDFCRLEYKKACELLIKEISLQRENPIGTGTTNEQKIDEDELPSMRQGMLDHTQRLTATAMESLEQSHLPVKYINRNTKKSNYRSMSVEKWTKKDVLDFLYDSNLHYMMPLCEVMTGHGLIKLFRMCQTKPSRFYGQLNDELRARFDGLHLPIGIFTEFLSEIDRLINSSSSSDRETVHSKSDSSSQSSTPTPASIKHGTKKPSSGALSEQAIQSTPQKTESPILTIQKSRNVQITEQTAYRKNSADTLPTNFMVHPSLTSSVVLAEPAGLYKPEQTIIDELTRQNQLINTLPYRRTSFTHNAQTINYT